MNSRGSLARTGLSLWRVLTRQNHELVSCRLRYRVGPFRVVKIGGQASAIRALRGLAENHSDRGLAPLSAP